MPWQRPRWLTWPPTYSWLPQSNTIQPMWPAMLKKDAIGREVRVPLAGTTASPQMDDPMGLQSSAAYGHGWNVSVGNVSALQSRMLRIWVNRFSCRRLGLAVMHAPHRISCLLRQHFISSISASPTRLLGSCHSSIQRLPKATHLAAISQFWLFSVRDLSFSSPCRFHHEQNQDRVLARPWTRRTTM